jgi:CubicO group peptidase (beta-lactamase class C family)
VLGCEQDAFVALDAPQEHGGVALAGGGLAASARDWARVALLLRDGTALGTAVLDPAWAATCSVPPLPFLEPGRLPSSITTHAGFGWAWWPLDREGRRVTADGSRGQLAYLDRDLDVVVVKTSAWPYDDWLVDRQLRDLSYLGLGEVASAAAAGARIAPLDEEEPA